MFLAMPFALSHPFNFRSVKTIDKPVSLDFPRFFIHEKTDKSTFGRENMHINTYIDACM